VNERNDFDCNNEHIAESISHPQIPKGPPIRRRVAGADLQYRPRSEFYSSDVVSMDRHSIRLKHRDDDDS
jgi:hypothetical protein